MEVTSDRQTRVRFRGEVLENKQIGPRFHRLTIRPDEAGARAFADVTPGRFIELHVSHIALPRIDNIPENLRDAAERQIILRRPFSFSDVREDQGRVELDILYCVLGPATVRMTTLVPGDPVDLIGPLGHGFRIDTSRQYALLVAGGMGAPPLQHLAAWLSRRHPQVQVVAFAGARSEGGLPYEIVRTSTKVELAEFSRFQIPTYVATDDGSIGHHGLVTEALREWLAREKIAADQAVIYACGPERMLAAAARAAAEHAIECQVSMEQMMACGIGLCQSCAIPSTNPAGERSYKLCCKEGPVFDSKEVDFE